MARLHWFWRGTVAVFVSILILQSLRLCIVLQQEMRGTLILRRVDYWEVLVNFPGGLPRVMMLTYALPILLYVALTRWLGPAAAKDNETRCRKCGYILRGISEPRCPECGERI
jgi:hypothetical protein